MRLYAIKHDENKDENKKTGHIIPYKKIYKSRHEHRLKKYKKRLTTMMLMCIKQHLSNI